MDHFNLKIQSIHQVVYDGESQYTIFPGVDGQLGVLPGHTRLMTPLRKGKIHCIIDRQRNETKDWEIDGGFLMVDKTGVKVLLA